jgi:predicted membrane protein
MIHDDRRRDRDLDLDHDRGRGFESRMQRRFGSRGRFHSLVIGGLIVTFGLTLLATNLGWTDMRSVMRQFWPFALVVLGLANLFNDRPGGRFWGMVMIVAGLWIYAGQRDWIHVQFWAVFGPTILILLGATVAWRALSNPTRPPAAQPGSTGNVQESGYINTFSVMSGSEHKPSTPFTGANLGAVMGGVKLDLSGVEMEGDTATIEIFAVMGGIEIYAPRDWDVTSRVVTLMGATVDKRRPVAAPPAVRKTLVITGFVFMGGVEIKD